MTRNDPPHEKKRPTDWTQYVGNPYQLCGTRHYALTQGYARGLNAIDVRTGGGLEYTVVPDRGLDLSLASFRGRNLTYLTPNGEMNPAFYQSGGEGWIKTFFAGLLTTCGYENVGASCEDEGIYFGQHGRQNVIPAKNVCDQSDGARGIHISGLVEDSACFGAKVRCKRTIVSAVGENWIRVADEFENYGIKDEPLLMLYHINFGYPFLSEQTRVSIDAIKTEPYNAYSEEDMANLTGFSKPDAAAREKNYIHILANLEGDARTEIRNSSGVCVYIRQKTDELPYLNHWKLENPIDYVLALEPSNVRCIGRRAIREAGGYPLLRAGEKKTFEFEIGVIEE